jgi:ABC-type multidrug transport system fused ATPase/permease subunit
MTDTNEHQLIEVGCYASTSIAKSKKWEVEMEHTNNNDSPESVAIEVSHLTQGYGKTIVLQDIDFKVHKGEILALIGPSGSGKTTLISTIMGMMPPKSGSVSVLGTYPMPNRKELGNIGFMAQTDALYMNLSGMENLRFFAPFNTSTNVISPTRPGAPPVSSTLRTHLTAGWQITQEV